MKRSNQYILKNIENLITQKNKTESLKENLRGYTFCCNITKMASYVTYLKSLRASNTKNKYDGISPKEALLNLIIEIDNVCLDICEGYFDEGFKSYLKGCQIILSDQEQEELSWSAYQYVPRRCGNHIEIALPYRDLYGKIGQNLFPMLRKSALHFGAISYLYKFLNNPAIILEKDCRFKNLPGNIKWHPMEYRIINKHLQKERGLFKKYLEGWPKSICNDLDWYIIANTLLVKELECVEQNLLYTIEKEIYTKKITADKVLHRQPLLLIENNLLCFTFVTNYFKS